MSDPVTEAADPSTSAARLAELAAAHPEARAAIARHPAVYDGLLEWMAADPATPAEALPPLADGRPALWDAVARHPNAYPELRSWIEDRRAAASAGAEAGAAVAGGAAVAARGDAARPASGPGGPTDPPVADGAAPAARRRLPRGAAIALVVVVVLLVVAAIAVPITVGALGTNKQAGGEKDAPRTSAPPTSGTATPTPTPTAASRLPKDCAGLFSDGVRTSLSGRGYELTASSSPAAPSDAELASLVAAPGEARLDCVWTAASGSDSIVTSVVQLDVDAAAKVEARLAASGLASRKEAGGTRYFVQRAGGGESDAVVNGVWFSTVYRGYGPSGYTADMVAQLGG